MWNMLKLLRVAGLRTETHVLATLEHFVDSDEA